MALAVAACIMLAVAQSSWWSSATAGDVIGTDFANIVWTLFNNTVMLTFIAIAWPRASK